MYDFTLKSSQAVSYLDIGSVLYKFLKRDWKFWVFGNSILVEMSCGCFVSSEAWSVPSTNWFIENQRQRGWVSPAWTWCITRPDLLFWINIYHHVNQYQRKSALPSYANKKEEWFANHDIKHFKTFLLVLLRLCGQNFNENVPCLIKTIYEY